MHWFPKLFLTACFLYVGGTLTYDISTSPYPHGWWIIFVAALSLAVGVVGFMALGQPKARPPVPTKPAQES